MAQLVVKLTSDLAAALTRGEASASMIQRVLDDLDVALKPLSPGVDDPIMATYFHATVRSPEDAAKVVQRLLDVPGVSAAYLRPTIGLP